MSQPVPDAKAVQRHIDRVREHGELCYCGECIAWRVEMLVGEQEEREENERNRTSRGPRHAA